MASLVRCPQGHEWESFHTEGSLSEDDFCPVCRLVDETLMRAAAAPAPPISGHEETLLPPPAPSDAPTLIPPAPEKADEGATMARGRRPTDVPRPGPRPPAVPPPTALNAVTAAARPGFPAIPGYDLLGELGRGGMGVVYKARQRGLDRVVALKMILSGSHSEDVLRFRKEALAVARLHHPNIVQIYEVGETAGKPYCALEFVPGGSLHERIHRAPPTAREAAELLEAIARAMHHAHEQGIVHRDLKPANILLDAAGQPKVSDFGLVKELDGDHGQTHTGAVMGTPSYMAPEQAQGKRDIGPAADVYALGGILYDMLTGRPPFRGETAYDTLHLVVHDDPVLPSRLRPHCPRDLETICLKCLQKEPAKRYASAAALADDLRRWLDGEPIAARPVRWPERAARWARRRPAAAALIALAAVLAVALPASAVWYARHERENARLAHQLRGEAERQQGRAEENFQAARAAVEEMLTQVAEGPLAQMPHMEAVRRELLDKALRFYEEFADRAAGPDPVVQRDRALASIRAGDIRRMLGQREAAKTAYRTALAILAERAESGGDATDEEEAVARNNLGLLLRELGRPDEAEAEYARAADLRQRLLDTRPDDPAQRKEWAAILTNLGTLRHAAKRLDAAEEAYRQALALFDGSPTDCGRPAARTRHNLARLLQERGRDDEAEALLTQACDLLPSGAGATAEDRQERAACLLARADLRRDRDPPAAEALYDEAVALRTALCSDFPAVPLYAQELATAHHSRALLRQSLDRRDDAEADSRRALAVKEKLAADYPQVPEYQRDLAAAENNRAVFLHTQNRLTEAETAYRRAHDIFGRLAARHPAVTDYRQERTRTALNLTALLVAAGRAREAEEVCRRALDEQERLATAFPALPTLRFEEARCRHTLATIEEMQGRLSEAVAGEQRAVTVLTALVRDHPREVDYRRLLAEAQLALALVQRGRGASTDGESACNAARSLYEALATECPEVPAYRQQLARCHNERAIFLASRGQHDAAEADFRHAAAIQRKLSVEHPGEIGYALEESRSYNNLGILLAQAGRPRLAEEAYRKAAELQRGLVERFPASAEARVEQVRTWQNLARLHHSLAAHRERERDLREIVRLCDELSAAFPAVEEYRREAKRAREERDAVLRSSGTESAPNHP